MLTSYYSGPENPYPRFFQEYSYRYVITEPNCPFCNVWVMRHVFQLDAYLREEILTQKTSARTAIVSLILGSPPVSFPANHASSKSDRPLGEGIWQPAYGCLKNERAFLDHIMSNPWN